MEINEKNDWIRELLKIARESHSEEARMAAKIAIAELRHRETFEK